MRKKKRYAKIPFDASDYVMSFPPNYKGPSLSGDLAAKYDQFLDAQRQTDPTQPKELATIPDYLDAAKSVYNFVPERVTEKEFKLRYAAEAAALGLSKEQVVRVYALETGGVGTYDMQVGIHPTKKDGPGDFERARLCAASRRQFGERAGAQRCDVSSRASIRSCAIRSNSPERTALLKRKLAVLKKMYANVKHQPFEWDVQQAYAKTREGMGMHTLNIDGDIGPMLQAMKLKTLQDTAEKQGHYSLSGAEIELMNLAGPVTGLEMMQSPGSEAPTTNFFARTRLLRQQNGDRVDRLAAAGRTRPAHDVGHHDAGLGGVRGGLRQRLRRERRRALSAAPSMNSLFSRPEALAPSSERGIIGIALGIAAIERRRVGRVQRRIELEAFRQVRIGDEQLAERDGVRGAGVDRGFRRFLGEFLVGDEHATERFLSCGPIAVRSPDIRACR